MRIELLALHMKTKLLFLTFFITTVAMAQDADTSYWKLGGAGNISFTQVSLTNWAAGGDNSVSLNGYFNVFADYEKDRISWSNNLETGYGIIRQGQADPRKTDDIILASTQFGYKLNQKLFWSSLLDFRTQFYEGLDEEGNRISDFMAPGYLIVATGLDWKPSPMFSITYAPITGKFTFVQDQELANLGAFGVDGADIDPNNPSVILREGSNVRAELGSFLKIRFKKENIVKNVNYNSKLELFSNYLTDFGVIDVNWQNQVVMKINSWLAVNWQTQLIYDRDIRIQELDANGNEVSGDAKVQFKSVFGVGLAVTFGATKEE